MAKFEDFSGNDESMHEELMTVNDEPKEITMVDEESIASFSSFNSLLQLQDNLNNCLQIIDDDVLKGYIYKIEDMPIVPVDNEYLESLDDVQFFKITELVYQENEFSPYKLASVFSTLKNKPCTLSLLIKSDGITNELYLGVRSLDKKYSSGTMRTTLESTLIGQFPGSHIEKCTDMSFAVDAHKCISSVIGVSDYKQSKERVDEDNFVQGLEKFINGMKGKKYVAVFLAENLNHDELVDIRHEYENIYSSIAPFANIQYSFSNNESNTSSDTTSKGTSSATTTGESFSKSDNESVNDSISDTISRSDSDGVVNTRGTSDSEATGTTDSYSVAQGKNTSTTESHSDSESVSKSRSHGGNAGASIIILNASHNHSRSKTKTKTSTDTKSYTHGFSKTETVSNSISKTLTHGINVSEAKSKTTTDTTSKGTTHGTTKGTTIQQGTNTSTTDSVNLMNSETLSKSFGRTQGVNLNSQNMALVSTLEKIEKQLKRIDDCESVGMWNFSAYFLGESSAEAESAAFMYQSVVMGAESGIESSAVNTWHLPVDKESDEKKIKSEKFEVILKCIKHYVNPQFMYHREFNNVDIIVEPTSRVSTNELSLQMGLPRHSVKGLPVTEHVPFAQEVISQQKAKTNNLNKLSNDEQNEHSISLGNIFHLGDDTNVEVNLDLNSLAMHTFITGSTGSGKSNAVYHLIDEIQKKHIPFLVIEPAKGEYRNVFKEANCYGTNPYLGELLQLNPFAFPEKIQVLEHIDRLVEIFNVCWPMYAAMPAVLKESIERAYRSSGWDLKKSKNIVSPDLFPTFSDVLRELNITIKESEYSQDTKGDYIGSLSTRLKSLTNGINGEIFTSSEMNLIKLFEENAIVDISHVGAMETKALIMGIIVLKLQEYRVAKATQMNNPLKHITVLEEAHNILKKTSTEQSQESSNMVGKSVEMLTNTIAEIRTYGEGFVIVDQAPNLLDTAVLRNTNTKIVFRLPEEDDRQITGKAMALSDDQIREMAKLETGVATVYQNDWQEAVLCKLPYYESDNAIIQEDKDYSNTENEQKDSILHILLADNIEDINEAEVSSKIVQLALPGKVRKDLIQNYKKRNLIYEWAMADFISNMYDISFAFRGTNRHTWENLGQLSQLVMDNIRNEFIGFEDKELLKIMYFICRSMHEKHPDNKTIENLRQNYLKWEVK